MRYWAVGIFAALSCVQAGAAENRNLSDCEQAVDNPDRAIPGCTAIINIQPADTNRAYAYLMRALAYYGKGNYDQAILDVTESIIIDPKNPVAFTNRGLAWENKKQIDLAIIDYTQAIALDPKHQFAWASRAELQRSRGKTGQAIADYQQAAWNANLQAPSKLAALIPIPPAMNYANESTDWNVPVKTELTELGGERTPTTVPNATVISTVELAKRMQGLAPFLLIDAWENSLHEAIPGAKRMGFAGRGGSFDDDAQQWLGKFLENLTGGRKDYALVFYCAAAACWEGYNAALRATKLGYTNVAWYRGGYEAWREAKLPLDNVPFIAEAMGWLSPLP